MKLPAARRTTRVLYILDSFPDPCAGTEGQFWLLFSELDRARVTPAILLLRPSAFLQAQVRDAEVKVLNVNSVKSLKGSWRVLRAVLWARRSRFEVAHTFFNDCSVVFPLLLKLVGIRVIVSRRDLGFWYTPALLRILRFNSRFVDAVIANADAVKRAVMREEHYPKDKVHVIFNAITRAVPQQSSDIRVRFGIPADASVLTVVGNLRPLKRVDDAIRALALLSARGSRDVNMLVVGEDRTSSSSNGSHQAELQVLAQSLAVSDKVHWIGKVADPMPAIVAADVCLLCSETEGLSNTIMEYMLARKPVVCTDVGGNRELIEEGRNGLLVKAGDVEALTSAIARLLSDPVLRAQFGHASKEKAGAMFDVARMIRRHYELYEAGGRAPQMGDSSC